MSHRTIRSLAGKVAIVTGGSAGIGRLTAVALARCGAQLVVVGRSKERLAETVAEIRAVDGTAAPVALPLDVRSERDMAGMAAAAVERFGRIDILVHSAGVLRPEGMGLKRIDQTPVDEWDYVVQTNLTGTLLANRAVLPQMIRQRSGDIVNLSSKSGRRGLAFDGPYCASKFAVVGLTEAIAEEVRQYGVRVQCLLPGTFLTGVWSQAGPLPAPARLPPAERVSEMIVQMVSLATDTTLGSLIIEPSASLAETGWRGSR